MGVYPAEEAAVAAQFVMRVKPRHSYLIANSISTPAAQAQWEAPPRRHSLRLLSEGPVVRAEVAARYGPQVRSG